MLYQQVDTAVIDGESLPWVPFAPYAPTILLKYFKLDPIRGEIIVQMRTPQGTQIPMHHHTGTVMVYTLAGQWKYKEHDWISKAGDVVYETAASTHTPEFLTGGADGYVDMLVCLTGDLVFLDENKNVVAMENWKTSMERYLAYCEEHDVKPKDLTAFN